VGSLDAGEALAYGLPPTVMVPGTLPGEVVKARVVQMRKKNVLARLEEVRTLLLQSCFTVVTLLLHCCYTVVTLLSYSCDTAVTLLLHFSYTLFTL
jgi:hypothetical protein